MRDLTYIWRSILSSHRLIALTIIAQIALALVVVGNAVPVIVGTLQSAWSPSGLAEAALGVVQIANGPGGSPDFNPQGTLASIAQVPGVAGTVVISSLPLQDRASTFNPYRKVDGNAVPRRVSSYVGSPGTVRTLGLRLLEGRDFVPAEYRPYDGTLPSTPSIIVNRSLAQYLWPGEEALGQRLIASPSHSYTVIGVADDVAETFPSSLHTPQFSVIFAGEPGPNLNDTFVFRYSGNELSTFGSIKRVLQQQLPQAAITGPRTFAQVRGDYLAKPVRVSILFALICTVVIVTMGVGIGTLAGYWIAQRSESIAIRRALGATSRDIVRYFMMEAGLLSGLGVLLGVGLTYLGNYYLGHFVEVHRPSIVLVLGAAAFFIGLNLAAVAPPLRRATRQSPAEVFRLR